MADTALVDTHVKLPPAYREPIRKICRDECRSVANLFTVLILEGLRQRGVTVDDDA